MSTPDVPGYNPVNRDQLAMGCWAEADNDSLIVVESTEGGRVVYSLFDLAQTPPVEYRDAMAELSFKKAFSWKSGEAVANQQWTWHDKTPFPWDRVIKGGAKPGPKYASADDQISAARKVAEALRLKAQAVNPEELSDKTLRKLAKLRGKIEKALEALPA